MLDVVGLSFADSVKLETDPNQFLGVVCNGIFAQRRADICICAGLTRVEVAQRLGVSADGNNVQLRVMPDCSARRSM